MVLACTFDFGSPHAHTARRAHAEGHRSDRIGWLRAAVLGANDGIVSTASLVVGVAAAQSSQSTIVVTAVAGLVAGAMSMAAGEYVSVHSQADTEKADLDRERAELATDPAAEARELTAIYVGRGLTPELAQQVSAQLMAHDALGAHARDELNVSPAAGRPSGASGPYISRQLCDRGSTAAGCCRGGARQQPAVCGGGLGAGLFGAAGAVAARTGGASMAVGAWRVTFWGALAMAITAGVGAWFGAPV